MFYLIGSPLGHSISPFIHRELARKKGIDIQYDLLETDVTKLEATVELLRSSDGFNVTIPHKTNIIPISFSRRRRCRTDRSCKHRAMRRWEDVRL